jgi:hypothetical protein
LKQRRICELQDGGMSAGQSGTQHAACRAPGVSVLFTMLGESPVLAGYLQRFIALISRRTVVQAENTLIISLCTDVFLWDATGQELLLILRR